MGIKRNEEDPDNDLMLDLLDVFGINKVSVSQDFKVSQNVNRETKDPEALRKVIKDRFKMV